MQLLVLADDDVSVAAAEPVDVIDSLVDVTNDLTKKEFAGYYFRSGWQSLGFEPRIHFQ